MGFMKPYLSDQDSCIGCDACKKVCTGRTIYQRRLNVGEVWSIRAKDDQILEKSSSGGVFPVVARYVLNRGGIVYGATFDEEFGLVRHQRVDDLMHLSELQGSKYIQSSMQGIFDSVAHDVLEGRMVLFSGTPCQVDALKLFLNGIDCQRLYLIDLFCYGVPSPRIWRQWLTRLKGSRYDARVVNVNFREKSKGWQNYSLRVDFDDGSSYVEDKNHDLYLSTFSKGAYLRESCYSCIHKAFPRESDLTLGDFQDIDAINRSFNHPGGVSMVKVNTQKGSNLLKELAGEFESNRVDARVMDAVHPSMGSSVMRDRRRDGIQRHIETWNVDKLLLRYGRELPLVRLKKAVKRLIKKHRGEG